MERLSVALARALPVQAFAQAHLPVEQRGFVFGVELEEAPLVLVIRVHESTVRLDLTLPARVVTTPPRTVPIGLPREAVPLLPRVHDPIPSGHSIFTYVPAKHETRSLRAAWRSMDLFYVVETKLHANAMFQVSVFDNTFNLTLMEGFFRWLDGTDRPLRYAMQRTGQTEEDSQERPGA